MLEHSLCLHYVSAEMLFLGLQEQLLCTKDSHESAAESLLCVNYTLQLQVVIMCPWGLSSFSGIKVPNDDLVF